jgi:hypothetical protein
MNTTTPATETNRPKRLPPRDDPRLIDMLEGALAPLRNPRAPRPEHDFLVINLHEDLSETAMKAV